MANVVSEFDPALIQREPLPRELWTVCGFNGGIALFVIGAVWQLCGPPSTTNLDHALKLSLIYGGLALAGPAWVAGLRASLRLKGLIIGAILAAMAYGAIDSAREFEASSRVLLPGHLEADRWVHDGLGLSFRMIPDWHVKLSHPVITESRYEGVGREGRSRLWPDERAVFFEMEGQLGKSGSSAASSAIRLEAMGFRFSTLDAVARYVRSTQQVTASSPGVKIARPVFFYRMNELDVAEFDFINEGRNSMTQCVFARSVGYMLCFMLDSARNVDRLYFQEFLRSIRITDRSTSFSG